MALDFFAGCLGGCAGIVVGYPLDTVKVHIQTQDHRSPKYRGTWHCFRTLVARESVSGLYRGMSSPMAGVAVVNAIIFGVYGQTHKYLNEGPMGSTLGDGLSSHFLAGAAAGMAQAPVCSPIELAKTRLQLQGGSVNSPRHAGPAQCLRHIYRSEGFRGVFGGLGITLAREIPSFGVYFATYEALTKSDRQISTPHMLLAGGTAGTVSWIVSYPLDVVKSRLQADSEGRYSGALDCFRKSVQAEGWICMVRGLNSTIIRAFPTNAATFAVVTWTMRLFDESAQSQPRQQQQSAAKISVQLPELFKPKSWNGTLDRYGESSSASGSKHQSLKSFGDTMETYLHRLGETSLALVPHQSSTSGGHYSSVDSHFDEISHFEGTREIIHY
ncbi:hypothetical protein TKK_0019229 [Trichogramma kaykai]|uniref:Mitochondrial basic amino acids transporter n=1 Tax=Trichogramma kaykai TaxID=54128 RepID=A0ABD2VTM2_9HYME